VLTTGQIDKGSIRYVTRFHSRFFIVFDAFHSSARLGGFEKDLHLRGSQYPALLAIVYVGFVVMQLPGYVASLLRKVYCDVFSGI
jgi:hypothetical protein